MNLTEMVDAIVNDTNLHIKRDQITRRVRAAISSVHSSTFYEKDIIEDFIPLDDNTHCQFSIPLPQSHRRWVAIAPRTSNRGLLNITTHNNQYTEVNARNVVDYWGDPRTDIFYGAGAKVNIISSVVPTALYVSWYAEPNVADPLLETWLMRAEPQVFMDWAVANFYKANGRENVARGMESTVLNVDLPRIVEKYGSRI